jgi:beta-lactamase regulating signal transducer with metallopeptidase domain
MNWPLLVNESLVERVGWTLIHFVWQAFFVYGVLRLVLPRIDQPQHRYLLACASLLVLAALPVFTCLVGQQDAAHLAIDAPLQGQDLRGTVLPTVDGLHFAEPRSSADRAWEFAARTRAVLQPMILPVATAWLAGLFGFLGFQAVLWINLQRKLSEPCPTDESFLRQFDDLLERMRVPRVRWHVSPDFESPATAGWWHPIVILPVCTLTQLSPDLLRALVAHELAHIRRHDYLVNLLQTVLEQLFFFHPAVWWLSRVIRETREECCDDDATSIIDAKTYARALAAMEELRQRAPEDVLPAMASSGGSLVRRIQRLVRRSNSGRVGQQSLPGLIVSFAAIGFAFIMLIHAPQSDDLWWATQRSRTESAALLSAIDMDSMNSDFVQSYIRTLAVAKPTNDELDQLAVALQGGVDCNALVRFADGYAYAFLRHLDVFETPWPLCTELDRTKLIYRFTKRARDLVNLEPDRAMRFARSALVLSILERSLSGLNNYLALVGDKELIQIARLSERQRERIRRVRAYHRAMGEMFDRNEFYVDERIRSTTQGFSPEARELLQAGMIQLATQSINEPGKAQITSRLLSRIAAIDQPLAQQIADVLKAGTVPNDTMFAKWIDEATRPPQFFVNRQTSRRPTTTPAGG